MNDSCRLSICLLCWAFQSFRNLALLPKEALLLTILWTHSTTFVFVSSTESPFYWILPILTPSCPKAITFFFFFSSRTVSIKCVHACEVASVVSDSFATQRPKPARLLCLWTPSSKSMKYVLSWIVFSEKRGLCLILPYSPPAPIMVLVPQQAFSKFSLWIQVYLIKTSAGSCIGCVKCPTLGGCYLKATLQCCSLLQDASTFLLSATGYSHFCL